MQECLTSQVISASVFIYFKECSDAEQVSTYLPEKLIETVDTSVSLMESMTAEVAHSNSVEQYITTAIKYSVYSDCIRSTGCSLHRQ
jgi:hypothetical protein